MEECKAMVTLLSRDGILLQKLYKDKFLCSLLKLWSRLMMGLVLLTYKMKLLELVHDVP